MRPTQLTRDIARRDATNTLRDLDAKAGRGRPDCRAATTTREAAARRVASTTLGLCDMADELEAREAQEKAEWPIPANADQDQLVRFARSASEQGQDWLDQGNVARAEELFREAAYYLRAIVALQVAA